MLLVRSSVQALTLTLLPLFRMSAGVFVVVVSMRVCVPPPLTTLYLFP